jgi:hypothetical protein
VPANHLHDARPCSDFVRRIWVVVHCLAQMLTRNDVHQSEYFTICEVVKDAIE